MEPFVEVFFAIDSEHNEEISIKNLEDYVEKNQLDRTMIVRWKSLFDPYNTGTITLDKFCDVLGLKPAEARLMRVEMQKQHQARPDFGPDVTILADDMKVDMETDIIKKTRELKEKYGDDYEKIGKELKVYLEGRWGRSWNVIITNESFWMEICYAAENSFHFKLGDIIYSMWLTPDLD